MIEISHKQAQHLIRQAMDRRLPEEQWSALQGHLERCEECRAYRQRLSASERNISQVLRLRWSGARGPSGGLSKYLLDRRERRLKLRKFLGKASWYVLGALLLMGIIFFTRGNTPAAPPPAPRQPATSRAPTPQPTAPLLEFRGLVAFASASSGNSEIYLLGAASGEAEISNLTASPAEETHPAWSPDGEWLAFLSDRGPDGQPTGKNEVYVMTIAGSRLTRLTARPDVNWQGPLEWSYDGKWIALLGHRRPAEGGLADETVGQSEGAAFLYLVPTDGGQPRSIAFTRGALPWVRFSSSLPLLAYSHPDEGLVAFNYETGWHVALTAADERSFGFRSRPSHAFDWSLGGRSLVYLAEGPYNAPGSDRDVFSMMRISPELEIRSANELSVGILSNIDRLEGRNQIRAVSWVPNSLQVAGLYDRSGCWTVHLSHAYNMQVPHRYYNELCVEGGLERSNWSADGNWLVLLARQPGESSPAVYALRAGEEVDRPVSTPRFERLSELDLAAQAGDTEDFALRVRPVRRSLAINPRAAAEPQDGGPTAPAARLAGQPGLPEWIYYSALQDGTTRIFRARTDGTETEALTGSDQDSWCPQVGPDGRVAFLRRSSPNTNDIKSQVFVMEADGANQVQLSQPAAYQGGFQRSYNCPVWSPDGKALAAYFLGQQPGLAILPADGSSVGPELPVRHLRLSIFDRRGPVLQMKDISPAVDRRLAGYASASLLWLPNDPADPALGADRILLVEPNSGESARLVEVDVSQAEDGELIEAETRVVLTGWDDVLQLELSPDGQTLAALTITYNRTLRYTGPTLAQLRLMDANSYELVGGVALNNVDASTAPYSRLAWLADGRLMLTRSIGQIGPRKSIFERLDPLIQHQVQRVQRLAWAEDLIFDAALAGSQAGESQWLFFAAESGLYALPLTQDNPIPILLTDEEVFEVGG